MALQQGALFPGLAGELGSATALLAAGTMPAALGAQAAAELAATLEASVSCHELMFDHSLVLPFDPKVWPLDPFDHFDHRTRCSDLPHHLSPPFGSTR